MLLIQRQVNRNVFDVNIGCYYRLLCVNERLPLLLRNRQKHDYQFLHRSKVPSMFFQKSLPRLPIPKLKNSCERFLAAVRPILCDQEYANTIENVNSFCHQEAVGLQTLLINEDANNKHTSYITQPWSDMYLTDRSPLPLNYNPLLVMKNDDRPEYQQQIIRATNLVISSLRFWRSLKNEVLEPEIYHMNPKKSDTENFKKFIRLAPRSIATYVAYAFKAFPLDMSQYNKIFGGSRIPQLNKDQLVYSSDSKHILVIRRGHQYAVDVLDADGNIEPPIEILTRLKAVLELDKTRTAAEFPLGVLTTGNRDDWARSRNYLSNISKKNMQLLQKEIDGSLFCLCLDSNTDPVYDYNNPIPSLKHLLAGSSENRWFDKSISLIISADGTTSINFEHSWGDGVAVLRYFNEIYNDTLNNPYVSTNSKTTGFNNNKNVRPIKIDLDEKICNDLKVAFKKNVDINNSLEMIMLRSSHINKFVCKFQRVSPDAIMQLAFQLAYRQLFNTYVGSYESCSTAAFLHGRTETVRPCTIATKSFCEEILKHPSKNSGPQHLHAKIMHCSELHGRLIKEAAMGQGFDRHLFALKNIALKNHISVPALYSSEAYLKINCNKISTSTLSSNAFLAGSFGPVVKDGLGIAYSVQEDQCGAVITSYKGLKSAKLFSESLEEALIKINTVLQPKV